MKGQVFNMANEKLKFVCDYMEGAHPAIMNEPARHKYDADLRVRSR